MNKFTKLMGALSVAVLSVAGASAATNPGDVCVLFPSNKTNVAEIPAQIQVTIPGMWSIEFDGATEMTVTMAGPEGISENILVTEQDLGKFGDDDNPGFELNLSKAYTAPGTYTFTVPGGKFYDFSFDFDNDWTFSYTVGDVKPEDPNKPEVGVPSGTEVIPAPGDVTAEELIGDINIVFADFQIPGDVSGLLVSMTNNDGLNKTFEVRKGIRKVVEDEVEKEYPDNRRIQFTCAASDFPKSGEYTFTATFKDLETVPANKGKNFSWTYNVTVSGEPVTPVAPAVPTIKVDGEEVSLLSYDLETGKSVEVTLEAEADADIYYKWDAKEFAKYEAPVTVSKAGVFEYYAQRGELKSEEKYLVIKETGDVPAPGMQVTLTPDNTVSYSELPQEISFKFPDEVLTLMKKDGKLNFTVRMVCEKQNIDRSFEGELYSASSDLKMNAGKFNIPAGCTDPGTYVFTALFKDEFTYYTASMEQHPMENVTFNYIVSGFSTRVEPGAGKVDELSEIKITVTNAEAVTLAEDVTPTFKTAIGNDVPFTVAAAGNVITITLNPAVTENGVYTLTLPANYIKADGMVYDKAIRLEYKIEKSGICTVIFADGETADVFAVDGRIVVRNADADAIRNLDRGIYVVKGQKFVVK